LIKKNLPGTRIKHCADKKLLIIGCPRSGTLYTTKGLQKQGYDINHEAHGKDGMVSWTAAHKKGIYGRLPKDFRKWEIRHQLRNPLDTVSSFQTISGSTWNWLSQEGITHKRRNQETFDESVDRLLLFWITWTELCMGVTEDWYQIEDISFPGVHKSSNTRPHTFLEVKNIRDSIWYDRFIELSKGFGYDFG
jgi:hypothetical protein